MQWLIDIIKDWSAEQGYLTASFVDRGDTTLPDWDHLTLTLDNAWHELDLSAIVPANATAVSILCIMNGDAVGRRISLRKSGNANEGNMSIRTTNVANTVGQHDMVVAASANQIIDYKITTGWNILILVVKGWWL